jgi:hypothetical protein
LAYNSVRLPKLRRRNEIEGLSGRRRSTIGIAAAFTARDDNCEPSFALYNAFPGEAGCAAGASFGRRAIRGDLIPIWAKAGSPKLQEQQIASKLPATIVVDRQHLNGNPVEPKDNRRKPPWAF